MLAGYFTTERPDMVGLVPPGCKRVLEVGCSAGGFSSLIQGAEVWGIEPNPEAASIAAGKLHKVLVGTYDETCDSLPDGYFDLVIANDVIEHMPDHDAFLQAIKRKMAPGGRLIGSLPNMRHITALVKLLLLKDWAYREEGILDRTHLRFFTRKSIVRSLDDNGYALDVIKGNNGVIRNGFCNSGKLASAAGRVLTLATVALTLGYYWDTQYPQYGFSAKLAT